MRHPIYDIILPLRPPPLRTRGRFLWITCMKCSNYVLGMLEMLCRLPCCFGDRVPFPETRVDNLIDLIIFSSRELDWWWRRRVSTGGKFFYDDWKAVLLGPLHALEIVAPQVSNYQFHHPWSKCGYDISITNLNKSEVISLASKLRDAFEID